MKQILAWPYYLSTTWFRWQVNRRAAMTGAGAIILPVFHRVSDDQANEWTTPTRVFIKTIRWLKRHFDLISIEEAQRRIRANVNHRDSVCITFDDGYEDNCDVAIPLMIEEEVPCTYFVTTDPVLQQHGFAHDIAMGNNLRPNTVAQLREMASAGIEIGAHTRTHADIGSIRSPQVLNDEIVTARNDLEDAIGTGIRYFAFPFGDYDNLSESAFQLARDANFEAVFSNYGGYNFPGQDAFHFQRRGVDGAFLRIKNWINRDPLRNRNIRRIDVPPQTIPSATPI